MRLASSACPSGCAALRFGRPTVTDPFPMAPAPVHAAATSSSASSERADAMAGFKEKKRGTRRGGVRVRSTV